MAKVFFFTDPGAIIATQNSDFAFGPLPSSSNTDIYNLENKFSVSSDSPVIAITKGIIIFINDENNSELLNAALVPINSYTAGFPIKLFIYRGIKKTSLIDSNNFIKVSDSSWSSSNILKDIKKIQDKINDAVGTPNVKASSNCLGVQYSSNVNSYIESIIFDNTDDFNPLIVEGGDQIGKFQGQNTLAGVEVLMDKIGYDPKINILRKKNHTLEVSKLVIQSADSEENKLKLRFQDRDRREEILAYLDLAAFYGTCKNQKVSIKGVNENFLEKFYNKNVIYIDIRDNKGFSYNHFFKESDVLKLGFYDSSNEIEYEDLNYYSTWPILRIINKTYNSSRENFWLSLPIETTEIGNQSLLYSYTQNISTADDKTKRKYHIISNDFNSANVNLNSSQAIKLNNWKYNNMIASNYILLKKSSNRNNVNEDLPIAWDNLFSLASINIFGNDVEQGSFAVNTYSSINCPIIFDPINGEAYTSTIGIAYDKKHVTFFVYKEQVIYSLDKDFKEPFVSLINRGKYNAPYNLTDYDSSTTNPNIGFLIQLANNYKFDNFELEKFMINDSSNNISHFLTYSQEDDFRNTDTAFNSLKSVSFTYGEYTHLKSITSSTFNDHSKFIKAKSVEIVEYENVNLEKITLTLSIPTVVKDPLSNILYMGLENIPADVVYNSLPITFTGVNYN